MQLSFENLSNQLKQQKISSVIDTINTRLGKNRVTIGVPAQQLKAKAIIAFGYIPE